MNSYGSILSNIQYNQILSMQRQNNFEQNLGGAITLHIKKNNEVLNSLKLNLEKESNDKKILLLEDL